MTRCLAAWSAAALAAFTAPALAVPIPDAMNEWHGPTVDACDGRCPIGWAIEQASPDRQAMIREAMEATPMLPAYIMDGATIRWMAYYEDGAPRVDQWMRADLDAMEPAWGWRLADGSWFVKVTGCQNWAIVLDGVLPVSVSGIQDEPAGLTSFSPPVLRPRSYALVGFPARASADWGRTYEEEACCSEGVPPTAPTPVPLPAGLRSLLAALAGLGMLKWRKTWHAP